MSPLQFLAFWLCWQACLQKALAGPTKKRLRDEASGDESEDWDQYALNLYSRNLLPGTLAKRNLEKGKQAGAKGLKLRGKAGKKNAARTLQRAFKQTAWPDLYWVQIPIKSKKTNRRVLSWHPFILPHEWMAELFADPEGLAKCQPAQGSKHGVALSCIRSQLQMEEDVIPFAVHGDGAPVRGRSGFLDCQPSLSPE